MKNKFTILLLALTFTAASCNQLFFGGSGAMGVFQSTDFGDSFNDINTIDRKNNLNSTSVNRLIFDPHNSSNLFLASSAGVYKAESTGWKLLLTNILVADVAVDPVDSNILYAAGLSDNHAKIVKTSDNASSWKDIYTEPTRSNAVTAVAVDPANHNMILAGLETGEVISSPDGGGSWKPLQNLEDQILAIRYGPNRNPYILTRNSGLYESKDGAKTFTNITQTLTGAVINESYPFSAVSQFLDLTFDVRQPGVIYLGTHEGLVRTVDNGANWSFVKMPVRNSQLRTSAVGVNPLDSNNIYAAVGSTLFKSINGGITWQTKPIPTNQEVQQILIDPNSPNVLYLSLGVRK